MGESFLSVRWDDHCSSVSAELMNLLSSGFPADCSVVAEGRRVDAHRLILSAGSRFFHMLFSEVQEFHPVVILAEVSFDDLKAVLDILYYGETQIPQERREMFLALAGHLQLKGLHEFWMHNRSKILDSGTLGHVPQSTSNGSGNFGLDVKPSVIDLLHEESVSPPLSDLHSEYFVKEETTQFRCVEPETDEPREDVPGNDSNHMGKRASLGFGEEIVDHYSGCSNPCEYAEAASATVTCDQLEGSIHLPHWSPLTILPIVRQEPGHQRQEHMQNTREDNWDEMDERTGDFAVDVKPSVIDLPHEETAPPPSSEVPSEEIAKEESMRSDSEEPEREKLEDVAGDDSSDKDDRPFLGFGEEDCYSRCGNCRQDEVAALMKPVCDLPERRSPNLPHAITVGTLPTLPHELENHNIQSEDHPPGTQGTNVEEMERSGARTSAGTSSQHQVPKGSGGERACKGTFESSVPHLAQSFTCSVCHKNFSRRREIIQHLQIHSGEKNHHCSICQKSFAQRETLIIHMRIHTGEKKYHCSVCQKSFTHRGHLNTHMRIHTGEKNYHCSVCQKSFIHIGNLNTHMRIHSGEKNYHCSVCQKSFTHSGNLNTHLLIHSGERNFKCSVCGKCFVTRGTLHKHMCIHTGEKNYHCSVCQKSFAHKRNLITHMSIHTGEKKYHCSACQKSFAQRGNLSRHMRIHTKEKNYHCSVCQKSFRHKEGLVTHMRIHTGEKNYHCSVCQKSFTHGGNLIIHMRIHTGEKKYHCSVCQKSFSSKVGLVTHMHIHTGEKNFHCSVCQKSFRHKVGLFMHMRIHTGEKNYHCSVCQKSFTQSGNLNSHMRIHTGEKKYHCSVCQKGFRHKVGLVRHMHIHTG